MHRPAAAAEQGLKLMCKDNHLVHNPPVLLAIRCFYQCQYVLIILLVADEQPRLQCTWLQRASLDSLASVRAAAASTPAASVRRTHFSLFSDVN
jgi:hypothetical protein